PARRWWFLLRRIRPSSAWRFLLIGDRRGRSKMFGWLLVVHAKARNLLCLWAAGWCPSVDAKGGIHPTESVRERTRFYDPLLQSQLGASAKRSEAALGVCQAGAPERTHVRDGGRLGGQQRAVRSASCAS